MSTFEYVSLNKVFPSVCKHEMGFGFFPAKAEPECVCVAPLCNPSLSIIVFTKLIDSTLLCSCISCSVSDFEWTPINVLAN